MRWRRRIGVIVLVALVVIGVVVLARIDPAKRASGSGDGGARPTANGTASHPAVPARPAPTTASPHVHHSVTLAFAGDVNFTGPLATKLVADPASTLATIAPAIGAADLSMVNLETAVTTRGAPQAKTYTFRAPPTALVALKAAGIDVATVANNHGLDYGPVSVDDALAASQSQHFPLVGIGHDERQAMAPYRTTIHGERVAVIGATQVMDDNLVSEWTATQDHRGLASAKRVDDLVAQVRAVRPTTDVLVVFLHWGVEAQTCPTTDQSALARRLVDAGADVVVGSHAHRVQGAGRMGPAVVAYGLGNFAFAAASPAAATSGILYVTVTGRHADGYRWEPAVIGADNVPRLETGSAAAGADAAWNLLRGCTGLSR